jgi:polar amino acid transport system substrate-binding protein
MQSIKLIITALTAMTISGCSMSGEDKIRDFENLSDKTIAVQEGTTFEAIFAEKYPSYNVIKVPTAFDIYKAIVSGKAEYGIDDDVSAVLMLAGGLSIDTANANMPAVPMGAVFNKKNTELQAQFNDFITELEQSGLLAEIPNKWFSTSSPSSLPVPKPQVTEGEPLNIVTEGDYPPFNLSIGGIVSGLDAELWTLFADKIGRPVKISVIPFSDIIPCIAEGKADMSLSGISISEERAKKVLFSKPYNNTYTIIVSSKRVK